MTDMTLQSKWPSNQNVIFDTNKYLFIEENDNSRVCRQFKYF